jgi:hypothetical protein
MTSTKPRLPPGRQWKVPLVRLIALAKQLFVEMHLSPFFVSCSACS